MTMMHSISNQLRHLSTCRALGSLNIPAPGVESKIDRKLIVKPKIGLEVHAQLNIDSKLFSRGGCATYGIPNSQLDLLDVSIPGTLPLLNRAAIRAAVVTAFGLNCQIEDVIHFDRKNYFYSDMPAGYQITQYNSPIARNGHIDFIVKTYHNSIIAHSQPYDIVKYLYHQDRMLDEEFVPYIKRSYIKQLQLEQDSAKTLGSDANFGLVDYNRSGAGLIEIVFEPDLVNPHEASSLVRDLIVILKSLDTCNCELQEGSLRVDANVSIERLEDREVPAEQGGRVELKNLNSLRSLTKGLAYEIQRQVSELSAGRRVNSESRSYDSKNGKTKLLRAKETAVDYRYVPEPSIPPLRVDHLDAESIKRNVEALALPTKLRNTLTTEHSLDLLLVAELLDEPGLSEYFLKVMQAQEFDANVVADFLIYTISNLKRLDRLPIQVDLADMNGDFMTRIPPAKMRNLFSMMFRSEISFATAFEVTKCLFTSNCPNEPRALIEQLGWFQSNDEPALEAACNKIISGMKNISKQYKRKGDRKYLRMMLEKLSEQENHQVNISMAIKCFEKLLRSGD